MNQNIERSLDVVEQGNQLIPISSRVPYFPLVVKKGNGSIIEDICGNKYIDFLSSASAVNTGHCHPKVVQAIREQTDNFILYTSVYTYNEAMVELARELCKITPGSFNKMVTFGLSGSDANDGAIKFARAFTGRSKIISFIGAYHGSTYGAISLSALSTNMRRKIGPLLPEIYHMQYPDCYHCPYGRERESCGAECIENLENALNHFIPPEEVAAVFIEPIAGDGGIIVPHPEYIKRLYDICRKNGILFISEEVQQGFGRTGKWFAIENYDVVPDMIIMAKSIASGMPLSAVIGREEIMKSLDSPAHLFTMSAHPVSCRAALATIDIIRDENLLQKSSENGKYIIQRFNYLKGKYEIIGDVRGIGLSIGVELVKDRISKERAKEAAAKICYRCWEKGLLLIFVANSVLRIQPPLTITKEQIDRGLEIIEESIEDFLMGKIPDEVLKVTKGW